MNNDSTHVNKAFPRMELGCTISAYGKDFEPDSFLIESNIPDEIILFKGSLTEKREFQNKKEEEHYASYQPSASSMPHLLIRMSKAITISQLLEGTVVFVQKYLEDIKKLSFHPGVEGLSLHFIGMPDDPLLNIEEFPADFENLMLEIQMPWMIFGSIKS